MIYGHMKVVCLIEQLSLSTIVTALNPKLEKFLTSQELETNLILDKNIYSFTEEELLELIEITILLNKKGTPYH